MRVILDVAVVANLAAAFISPEDRPRYDEHLMGCDPEKRDPQDFVGKKVLTPSAWKVMRERCGRRAFVASVLAKHQVLLLSAFEDHGNFYNSALWFWKGFGSLRIPVLGPLEVCQMKRANDVAVIVSTDALRAQLRRSFGVGQVVLYPGQENSMHALWESADEGGARMHVDEKLFELWGWS